MITSTELDGARTSSGTSGIGKAVVILGAAFLTAITGSGSSSSSLSAHTRLGTNSGIPVEGAPRTGLGGVRLIRKLAGLTLEDVARLLGVSRRTIHNWQNGRPVSPASEVAIAGALSFIESLGSLPQETIRGALLMPLGQGRAVVDVVQRDPGVALMAARLALTRPHKVATASLESRQSQVPMPPSLAFDTVDVPSPSLSENRRPAKVTRIRSA